MATPLPPTPVGLKLVGAPAPDVVVEMFHDVCCPYSKKMYGTVHGAVIPALAGGNRAGRVEFLFQAVPQPWHGQSGFMHDAVMAAHLVDAGRAPAYIAALFARQDAFFDDATKDLTRVQIYAKLAALGAEAGYDPAALADRLDLSDARGNSGLGDVTQHLKWFVRYHRARGVHVTPTVFINGIEAPDVSSGWAAEDWLAALEPLLA